MNMSRLRGQVAALRAVAAVRPSSDDGPGIWEVIAGVARPDELRGAQAERWAEMWGDRDPFTRTDEPCPIEEKLARIRGQIPPVSPKAEPIGETP